MDSHNSAVRIAPSPLQQNAFIAALAASERALVTKHSSPLDLRVGQRLIKTSDMITDVIFPHSGLVVLTVRQSDNGAVGVGLVGQDGIVGGFAAMASTPASCDAEVHIAGHATRLAAPIFRELVDANPDTRQLASRFDSALMEQAHQTAYCNTKHPVEARVCRLLAEVLDRSTDRWALLNQAALAEILSVRRTTVTLVIGRLEDAGVLRWRRGYVDIVDHAELIRRSCGCYACMRRYRNQLFPAEDDTVRSTTLSRRTRAAGDDSIPH